MEQSFAHRTAADELSTHRSRAIFIVTIIFTITSTASIVLRLIAKHMNRAKLLAEDYVILVAQFLLYGMATAVMLQVFLSSAGHHVGDIPPSHVTNFLKILVAMQAFYGTILGLIKTSICLFYSRIFFVRTFRIAAWITIGFVLSWGLMVVLTAFLLCTPLAFNWDQTIPGGRCANQKATFIAVGVLDLVTDVCVFVLPLPMIYNLKVSRGNRVALFGIFGIGILTMIISILRIQSLLETDYTDITYSAAYPLMWSFLEPALGITVACGPLLGPLVRRFRYFRQVSKVRRLEGEGTDETTPFGRSTDTDPASRKVGQITVQTQWEMQVIRET